jgi:hypothetical protein
VASLLGSFSALLPTALGGSGSAWDLSFSTALAYSTSLLVLLSLQAGVPAGPPDAFGREVKAVSVFSLVVVTDGMSAGPVQGSQCLL